MLSLISLALQFQCVELVLVSVVYDIKPDLNVTETDKTPVETLFESTSEFNSVIALRVNGQYELKYTCPGVQEQTQVFTVKNDSQTEIRLKCIIQEEKVTHTIHLEVDKQPQEATGFNSVNGELQYSKGILLAFKYGQLCVGVLNGTQEYEVCNDDGVVRSRGSGEVLSCGDFNCNSYSIQFEQHMLKVSVTGPNNSSMTVFPIIKTPRMKYNYFIVENAPVTLYWFVNLRLYYDNSTIQARRLSPSGMLLPGSGYTGVLGRLVFSQTADVFEEHVMNNLSLSLSSLKDAVQRNHQFVSFNWYIDNINVIQATLFGDFDPSATQIDLDNAFQLIAGKGTVIDANIRAILITLPSVFAVTHAKRAIYSKYSGDIVFVGQQEGIVYNELEIKQTKLCICSQISKNFFNNAQTIIGTSSFYFNALQDQISNTPFNTINCPIK